MPKQLILLRHGKSDWDADDSQDINRPLTKRGIKAARRMGLLLTEVHQLPDIALTSPAQRAQQTVALAAQSGAWNCPVKIVDSFYQGSPVDVFLALQTLPETITTALVTGHEPTWTQLLQTCIGSSRVRFPTATLAGIALDIPSWQVLEANQGTLLWFLPPRLFIKGT